MFFFKIIWRGKIYDVCPLNIPNEVHDWMANSKQELLRLDCFTFYWDINLHTTSASTLNLQFDEFWQAYKYVSTLCHLAMFSLLQKIHWAPSQLSSSSTLGLGHHWSCFMSRRLNFFLGFYICRIMLNFLFYVWLLCSA